MTEKYTDYATRFRENSSADFAELMSKFTNDFIKNNQDILTLEHRESGIDSLKKKLQEADSAITDLAIKLKKKTIYTNTSNVANVVLDTGHIPIMLSNISPASAYGRAARSVSSYDVETYFDNSPGAEGQAREYCVKTDMMKTIATLREDIVQVRYKTDSKSNLFFVID